MIDVYFIRHGETDGNAARRNQTPVACLTQKGEAEARAAGERLKALRPTHLFVSSVRRALETTRIVGEVTGLAPTISDLYTEMRLPQKYDGRHTYGPTTALYLLRGYFGWLRTDEHDGESYDDFLDRLAEAREALAGLPDGARVAIITHGAFIVLFRVHTYLPRIPWYQLLFVTYQVIRIKNGSVMHMQYDTERKTWPLVSHN